MKWKRYRTRETERDWERDRERETREIDRERVRESDKRGELCIYIEREIHTGTPGAN